MQKLKLAQMILMDLKKSLNQSKCAQMTVNKPLWPQMSQKEPKSA